MNDLILLEQPESDIIVRTYPCTKYSPIADIHGTRTGDDLFLHFFRHFAIARPEMYIVENVPGLPAGNGRGEVILAPAGFPR